MKTLIFNALLLTIVSTSAFAAPKTIVTCTTFGDILDFVSLVKNDNGSEIQVGYMSGEMDVFQVDSGVVSENYIGVSEESQNYGSGLITNSVLFNYRNGSSTAMLAMKGDVYSLIRCK